MCSVDVTLLFLFGCYYGTTPVYILCCGHESSCSDYYYFCLYILNVGIYTNLDDYDFVVTYAMCK